MTEHSKPSLEAAQAELARLDALKRSPAVWNWTDVEYEAYATAVENLAVATELNKRAARYEGMTVMKLDIRSDIPIPVTKPRFVYPLENLKVGDCVIGSADVDEQFRMKQAFARFKAATTGWGYVSRTQPDGTIRFWRKA